MRKNIPNYITSANLLCGLLGILFWNQDALFYASIMIFAGAFFDFFDGMVARTLGVSSPIGKDLDSLADMVTFGVLPGLICFNLIAHWNEALAYSALAVPILSAWRLARFNNDVRQNELFIGLPTPANAIFFASLTIADIGETPPWIQWLLEPNTLAVLCVAFSLLLVSKIRLFSLKFKNWNWDENKLRYVFLILSFVLIVLFKTLAIPMIILLYIIVSFAVQRSLKDEI